MRHLRPRSAYDVLALVSFFLVIGGGTALASFVVSSNSQIGPGTVSGHKPPTGKHSNIITSSVNAQDLAPGAVTGSRLANASVTTSKLSLPKISFSGSDTDANDNSPHHTVLTVDGLTLGVSCTSLSMPPTTELHVYAKSSAGGELRGSYSTGPLGAPTPNLADLVLSSTSGEFASVQSSGAGLLAGEFTYQNANRVIGILLDGSAILGLHSCDLHGVVLPAPN